VGKMYNIVSCYLDPSVDQRLFIVSEKADDELDTDNIVKDNVTEGAVDVD